MKRPANLEGGMVPTVPVAAALKRAVGPNPILRRPHRQEASSREAEAVVYQLMAARSFPRMARWGGARTDAGLLLQLLSGARSRAR